MIAKEGLGDKVTFVGSQTTNQQNCRSGTTGFDVRHEGHSGWMAVDIANRYLANWLQKTPADIVQFMLGTNDVRAHGLNDITAAYTKMFGLMRAANPKMKIIVSHYEKNNRNI
jgi:lysophospholipase L1-like esterase